jgi:hypothetical protein
MKTPSIPPLRAGSEPAPWSAAPFNPLDNSDAGNENGASFKLKAGLVSKPKRDDDEAPFTD